MECSNVCQAKKELVRWSTSNETRQLGWSGIALWAGALFAGGSTHYLLLGLAAAALLTTNVWRRSLKKQAEAALGSLEHENVHEIHARLSTLKIEERTQEKLLAAAAGRDIVEDGLSCYERGHHVPTCTHRRSSTTV